MHERGWRCDWIGRLVGEEKGGVTREGVCMREGGGVTGSGG